MDEPDTEQAAMEAGRETEPQPSALESLLRRVAQTPLEQELPHAAELGPGVVVAGRFEVVREIGRGGFARVFEARDRVLSRPVAIKLLKRRRMTDPELELFYREARATARLNHPHIVTAYDWGIWNDAPFLVLELLDGESLQATLASGPLPSERAWQIAREVAQALVYAHSRGVLHLDLKSENIVVLRDGRVKVLDFGLAGLESDGETPGGPSRIAGGTPATMAPEQEEGATTDARTDLWAVGVLLHQMLLGRLPERLGPQADRVALPAGASARAQEVLGRTLCRDPAARYPDAVALARALAGEARGRTHRGRLARVLAASALVAAALAGAGVTFARLQKADYFWRNPLSNARFQRLTDFEGPEHSAAISRDGQQLAFLSSRDGQVGVLLTRIGTGTFLNMTSGLVPEQLVNREIRTVEFSPDGARLFFWVGASDTANKRLISTWVVPTRGGQPRLALEDVAEIGWSPDGRQLAYHTTAPGDPMFVSSDGAEGRPLHAAPAPQHSHFPTWAPDGSYLYFVQGFPPNEMDIWRIPPSGGAAERITFHNSRVSYPTFLDRSTLLYLATGTDGTGPWIYGMDVERRIPHRLSSGVERWTSLAASHDGRRLVATSTQIRPSLWRVPLASVPATLSEARRIPLPTAHGRSPILGADFLLYVSSDGTTERIWKLVGGRASELWSSEGARIIGGPAIVPDGGRMAFSVDTGRTTRLLLMNLDGTGLRIVSESLELRGAPVWSPDGRSIVTAANQRGSPRLFRVSLETGEAVRILDDYALDPAWAPGGDFLVYSGMDPGTTFPVKAIRPDGQPYPMPELTLSRGGAVGVTQVSARRLRFLPGEAGLVVLRGDIQHKNLWARELASGRWRELTRFGRDVVIGDFDVSSDGTAVVLERVEENSDIVVIDRQD